MGSWNNTCGLTNLPIISGEEVYVFPIKEKDLSGYRSHCYANALYDPVLTPFLAKYNDYGAGEECSGMSLPLIIDALKNNLVVMEQGENPYHDIPVVREEFDVDKFFEAIHEDRLFVKGWGNKHEHVYFTMIRKDVVDRMWNEWTFDLWTGKGKGSDPNDYYERNMTYAKLAEQIPEYVEECIAEYNAPAIETEKPEHLTDEIWKIMISKNFRRMSGKVLVNDSKTLVSDSFRMFSDHQHHWDLFDFKIAIADALDKSNQETLDESTKVGLTKVIIKLMESALIGVMVNSMMESTRKIWLPVMHMGSQSEEYAEYKFLNQITNDVMSARETYFDE